LAGGFFLSPSKYRLTWLDLKPGLGAAVLAKPYLNFQIVFPEGNLQKTLTNISN